MTFRWKDRKTYIERTAILAYRMFCDAQQFCAEQDDPLKPGISWHGILDNFIEKYSLNADEQSVRSMRLAKCDIRLEAYELARMWNNIEAKEYFG